MFNKQSPDNSPEECEDFSFGSYGDYSGVTFYGPPTNGFWFDLLTISRRYLDPLFSALIAKAAKAGEKLAPALAIEWNEMTGWWDARRTLLSPQRANEFIQALEKLSLEDVARFCHGYTPAECLRCAAVIREYIETRLANGVEIYIENG